jgi:hypothetical protein
MSMDIILKVWKLRELLDEADDDDTVYVQLEDSSTGDIVQHGVTGFSKTMGEGRVPQVVLMVSEVGERPPGPGSGPAVDVG